MITLVLLCIWYAFSAVRLKGTSCVMTAAKFEGHNCSPIFFYMVWYFFKNFLLHSSHWTSQKLYKTNVCRQLWNEFDWHAPLTSQTFTWYDISHKKCLHLQISHCFISYNNKTCPAICTWNDWNAYRNWSCLTDICPL